MKSFFSCSILILLFSVVNAQELQQISGRVAQMGQPLSNVNILIEETGEGTYTNSSGFYKIETRPGSTVNFTHAGLRTVKIIVEDVTKILNVEMEPKYEQLDEVTVLKRKSSTLKNSLLKITLSIRALSKPRLVFPIRKHPVGELSVSMRM